MRSGFGSKYEGKLSLLCFYNDEGAHVTGNASNGTGEHDLDYFKDSWFKQYQEEVILKAKADYEIKIQSDKDIAPLWRDDMVKYEGEPMYLMDKTLAGILFYECRDCYGAPGFIPSGPKGYLMSYDDRHELYFKRLIDGGIYINRSVALLNNPEYAVRSPILKTTLKESEGMTPLSYACLNDWLDWWVERGAAVFYRNGNQIAGWRIHNETVV